MPRPERLVRPFLVVLAGAAAAACATARFDGPDGDRRFFEARCGVCHQPPVPSRFGAREWPRERFLEALAEALERPTRRGSWAEPPAAQTAGAGRPGPVSRPPR